MTGTGLAKPRLNFSRARKILVALAIPALIWPQAAPTAAVGTEPEPVAQGTARRVGDGDTLVLATGTQVHLVGIQAPKLPLGRRGFKTWPLAGEAKAALKKLALEKKLRLSYGGRRIDRHGQLLAHLYDEKRNWIQGMLLAQGMAWVYTFPNNRGRAAEMLALGQKARVGWRGIRRNPYYRIRGNLETAGFIGTFQLVEGLVRKVAVVRGMAHLNFGADWKTNFTVAVSPRNMRRFKRGWNRIESFEGTRIRVRGWLKSYNSPMIEATHPEQIERLAP